MEVGGCGVRWTCSGATFPARHRKAYKLVGALRSTLRHGSHRELQCRVAGRRDGSASQDLGHGTAQGYLHRPASWPHVLVQRLYE